MEEIRFCPYHGFYRGERCKCGAEGELILTKRKSGETWKIYFWNFKTLS